MAGYRINTRGYADTKGKRKIAVSLDPELFNLINRMALQKNYSFSKMTEMMLLEATKDIRDELNTQKVSGEEQFLGAIFQSDVTT